MDLALLTWLSFEAMLCLENSEQNIATLLMWAAITVAGGGVNYAYACERAYLLEERAQLLTERAQLLEKRAGLLENRLAMWKVRNIPSKGISDAH